MPKDYHGMIADISAYTAELRKAEPDTMAGFYQMAKAASADGTLDKQTKELIAMAIGVALRCDGCIGFHAKALVDLGVGREAVTEALGMSIYMGGGPSVMYAADALRAYDQFAGTAQAA